MKGYIITLNDMRKGKFFEELVRELGFVENIMELKGKKAEFVKDLADAFEDVRLHQAGKKKLKSAKQMLNEL